MWQEIAIIIIGIAVAIYIVWKIYKNFTRKRNPDNPCCGCNGCDLKNQIKDRRNCP